jgi:hypothetical protein
MRLRILRMLRHGTSACARVNSTEHPSPLWRLADDDQAHDDGLLGTLVGQESRPWLHPLTKLRASVAAC